MLNLVVGLDQLLGNGVDHVLLQPLIEATEGVGPVVKGPTDQALKEPASSRLVLRGREHRRRVAGGQVSLNDEPLKSTPGGTGGLRLWVA